MTNPASRFSEWRVNMRLDHAAQNICIIHGQDPNDLVRLALREYIERVCEEWYNIQTYAIVMELRSNPDWEACAFEADDYKEFQKLLTKKRLTSTRGGVYIRDKRIARQRVSIEIRKRNKDVENEIS